MASTTTILSNAAITDIGIGLMIQFVKLVCVQQSGGIVHGLLGHMIEEKYEIKFFHGAWFSDSVVCWLIMCLHISELRDAALLEIAQHLLMEDLSEIAILDATPWWERLNSLVHSTKRSLVMRWGREAMTDCERHFKVHPWFNLNAENGFKDILFLTCIISFEDESILSLVASGIIKGCNLE